MAFAAVVAGTTVTYKRPGGDRLATFSKLNEHGYPTTFSIVGAMVELVVRADWYRVKLPIRPNGRSATCGPATSPSRR